MTRSQGYYALLDVIMAAAATSVAKIWAFPLSANFWMLRSLRSLSSGTVPVKLGSFLGLLNRALSHAFSKTWICPAYIIVCALPGVRVNLSKRYLENSWMTSQSVFTSKEGSLMPLRCHWRLADYSGLPALLALATWAYHCYFFLVCWGPVKFVLR